MDSLTLFGLFAAQVTGSFVIAGAELVRHDAGVAGKLLAIVAFIAAAAITAALIALARERGYAPMPWMLALEAVLLAVFVAIIWLGPDVKAATDWPGIIAGLFAACAMGAQSVLVRLLMKGIPQTNVMTGNMTQLGIALTDIVMAWRTYSRSGHDAAAAAPDDQGLALELGAIPFFHRRIESVHVYMQYCPGVAAPHRSFHGDGDFFRVQRRIEGVVQVVRKYELERVLAGGQCQRRFGLTLAEVQYLVRCRYRCIQFEFTQVGVDQ